MTEEILKNAVAEIPELQWFPGHMKKAERLIQENLKIVDAVIELIDARIPVSGRNPLLRELIGDKPRIIALTKCDLADEKITKTFLEKFRSEGFSALAIDTIKGTGIKNLISAVKKSAETKLTDL